MPSLKRPASALPPTSMKRPSGSIKDVVSELQNGMQEEDENEQVEVRDKQKAQKFHKMLSSGSLPDHIVHMYQVESKKSKEGARAYQTKLINQLFSKTSDGTYRLMTDKHEFQEYRQVFQRTVAKDTTEAIPRTLMLAKNFHGNEVLLKKAIDNGEVVAKTDTDSNIEYLQFRKLKKEIARGNEEGEHVEGTKKVSKEQAHAMADVMSKLKWKFQLTKASAGSGQDPKVQWLERVV